MKKDIDNIKYLAQNMLGRTFCPLGDAATSCITSSIQLFRDEYLHHVREGRCLVGPRHAPLEAVP